MTVTQLVQSSPILDAIADYPLVALKNDLRRRMKLPTGRRAVSHGHIACNGLEPGNVSQGFPILRVLGDGDG